MPPKLKLTYFDIRGRAEPVRLALTLGDIPFEDVRMSKQEFDAAKQTGKLPFGALPVLEVDGKMVCQSFGIMNYASKLAGVYPKDDFVALKAEEVKGCLDDTFNLIEPTFFEPDAAKKLAMRKELVDGKLSERLEMLEKLLVNNGTKHSVCDEITSADLELYVFAWTLSAGILDGIPTDIIAAYQRISALSQAVAEHPKVDKWNKDHPFPPT
eukprot:CAMPEP_0196747946 /NCGR_PEP_ID=MMETSP1091-20130531/71737_1 /TAXON_ID=302021 /ORGANISM="Rhodomonas sp., Strain CCMP768" /LENGTH=211 /DNA_ID=CAMNT_0042095181 /DNA_START=22 /DNA_END=657 /DNA_ORIENTATION=+